MKSIDAKREPRSMTLVDLIALVAGVAGGYAAITSQPGLAFLPPDWVLIAIGVSNLFLWLTIAFSTVAMGRVVAYRRMPRPAEWLAIVVASAVQAGRPEFNVDGYVNDIYASFPSSRDWLDFDEGRWLIAGLACLAILATLGGIRLGRRALPPWIKTMLLAGSALIAVAGPLWAFGFLGDDLVSPSRGFGAGDLAIVHRLTCVLFGDFPMGVFFGVPIMGALLDRFGGPRWAWGEWAAATTTPGVGLAPMVLARGDVFASKLVPGELGLLLAWTLAVAFASWLILKTLGGPGRRWIEVPGDQDRSSPSGLTSESRTV